MGDVRGLRSIGIACSVLSVLGCGGVAYLVSGQQGRSEPGAGSMYRPWGSTRTAADDDANIGSNKFARGISLAAAEFNDDKMPGVYGHDYIYPPVRHIDYYKSRGFDVVRLPFRWERLQPTLFGSFDANELLRIKEFIAAARARDVKVILSPHNYGRYRIEGKLARIGLDRVPIDAFADFWGRLAAEVAGDSTIYALSLMNEPHDSSGLWKATAQTGLDAIRQKDRRRLVLAPGDQWSGAWSWRRFNNKFLLTDPTQNLIYEAHQYFDANRSGQYRENYVTSGAYPDVGIDLIRPFTDWLREHRVAGIVTEFGVPNNDPRWLEVVDRLLPWLEWQRVPWVYWAGGPWWGNYPLSAEPTDGIDAPIMSILSKSYKVR